MQHDVRWLLLNFPAKAMHYPEALPILLGSELPHDVRFQLKVRIIGTGFVKTSQAYITIVSPLLGTSQPRHRCHLLFAGI